MNKIYCNHKYIFLYSICTSMKEGPSDFMKLNFQRPVNQIHTHHSSPFLLHSSDTSITNFNTQHMTPIRELPILQESDSISHIRYLNNSIIYTSGGSIRVNEHQKVNIHTDPISQLLTDDFGVALTCARSNIDKTIKVSWLNYHRQNNGRQKQLQVMGQFSFHYEPVTALHWKNSLVISGDQRGDVCLWDINKFQTILHRKAHYQSIQFIGTYVDYMHNNVFYTIAPSEKRLIFSDLRTNKPIKIIANLPSQQIISVQTNPSGKVIIAYSDIVGLVDIHMDYKMHGFFSPAVLDKKSQMKWTAKSFSFDNIRKITSMHVTGKYVIVGCDNGCIEVYNTDSMQCLYGFGLTKYGPIKGLQVNGSRKQIFGLDSQGDVYMAKYQ